MLVEGYQAARESDPRSGMPRIFGEYAGVEANGPPAPFNSRVLLGRVLQHVEILWKDRVGNPDLLECLLSSIVLEQEGGIGEVRLVARWYIVHGLGEKSLVVAPDPLAKTTSKQTEK